MFSMLLELSVVPALADPADLVVGEEGESLAAVAKRLAAAKAPALVLVNGEGKATGLLKAADLLAAAATSAGRFEAMRAAELKQPLGDHVAPGDPVLDAIQLMRLRGADCLAVLDDGCAVALVTPRKAYVVLARAVEEGFRASQQAVFSPAPEE